MQKEYIHNLILRYLNNEITNTELKYLANQVNTPNNENLEGALEKLWMDYANKEELKNSLKEDIYTDINTLIGEEPQRGKTVMFYLKRIAAILLVVFMGYQFVSLYLDKVELVNLASNTLQVKTDKGQRTQIILPDSTKVLLNVESAIEYPISFGMDERKLNLTGEAFFKVAKNANQKFVINTEYFDIEVLGTTFNVVTNDNSDRFEINLLEGHVKVSTRGANAEDIFLDSDRNKMIYNRLTNEMMVKESNHQDETSWVAGRLVFRSTPLKDVLVQLEKWYGVDIHVNLPDSLLEDRFTSSFDNQEISGVLKVLREYYNINYKIFGYNIYIIQ